MNACCFVGLGYESRGFGLAYAGTNSNSMKAQFSMSPAFTELPGLGFANGRKLVVVRLEEGRLTVSREKNSAHDSFCALCTSALLFLEVGERFSLLGKLF